MAEGEAIPQTGAETPSSEPLEIPFEAEEMAKENMSIISEVILEHDIDKKFAKKYARLYTIHTIDGIDAILGNHKSQPKMLVEFRNLLQQSVKDAEEQGDYTDISRFLSSEREKMKGHPDFAPDVKLADKLGQMIEFLPTGPTDE